MTSKFLSVLCGRQKEIYWLNIQFKKTCQKGFVIEKTSSSWGAGYLNYSFTSKYLLVNQLHQTDFAGK